MASEFSEARVTLVDSTVLIDVITGNETWAERSATALTRAADAGPLVINPVIFAEVSMCFTSIEDLEEVLPPDEFSRAPLPWPAAFLAGRCFVDYRRRGGVKTSPLPDFFIGAHAAVQKFALLTRDTNRYRTYFPTVELICPE